jgi:hypothetical protein
VGKTGDAVGWIWDNIISPVGDAVERIDEGNAIGIHEGYDVGSI